jgi:hypothetical protein
MSLGAALGPFASTHHKPTFSARGRARHAFEGHVNAASNKVVSALSFLSATDSSACTAFSRTHADIRAFIYGRSAAFCKIRRQHIAGLRGQQQVVAPSTAPLNYADAPPCALPIQADLIDLPSSQPVTQLTDLLPADVAAQLTPASVILPAPVPCATGPAVALGERHEYVALCRRLLAADLAVSIAASDVQQRVGLFCVRKGADRLRLIADARRTNAAHARPPRTQLPNPGNLPSLEAESFVAGCQDLSSFYYMLRLPAWLAPWFTLPRLSAEEALSLGISADAQLAMAVVPMGWSWAVYLAEAAHMHLLAAVRPASELLLSADPHVLSTPESLVYIDDHPVLAAPTHAAAAQALQAQASDCYVRAGLVENAAKRCEVTDGPVKILGLLFHGAEGHIAPPPDDLFELCDRTERLAAADHVHVAELRSVTGQWLWYALLNRPFLSVFSAVFAFIIKHGDATDTVPTWDRLRAELRAAVGLAPLLVVDTRQRWCDYIVATDASDTGFGVAMAPAAPEVCRQLAATLSHPASDPSARGADPSGLIASLPWRDTVSRPWAAAHPSHIMSGELFALTIGLRHCVAARQACNKRILLLTDNTAVLGAVKKGRSSGHALRSPMRVLAAWILATGVRLEVRYVASACNPADAASRAFA